jgi:hypothetical protein
MERFGQASRSALIACVAALAAACTAEPAESAARDEAIINGGAATTARPEVGQLGVVYDDGTVHGNIGCTATLISRRYFVTAAHCIGYQSRFEGGAFIVTLNPPPPKPASATVAYAIKDIYALNGNPVGAVTPCDGGVCVNTSGAGAFDLAIGRLTSEVDSNVATPAVIATRLPNFNETVTQFGYGCLQKLPTETGPFVKRSRSFPWPPVDVGCSGDSGGPVFLGDGTIAALASANNASMSGTADTDAFPVVFKAQFEALMRTLDDGKQEPLENNTDRGGGDLPGMPLTASGAGACGIRCANEPKCRAFTSVGTQCWLKGSVPAPTTVNGRTSSVMQGGLEIGINRPGSDITHFSSTVTGCRDTCNQRTDCQAFTFRAIDSTCYIKSRAPDPAPLDGVTSGLPQHRGLFNLPGADLAGMPLANQSFDGCEAACAARSDCLAYTFTINNNNCWLKSAVPTATACNNCWSGFKRSLEVNVDRPNNDVGNPVAATSAGDCQRKCVLNNSCVAFTYDPGPKNCWLKQAVSAPRHVVRRHHVGVAARHRDQCGSPRQRHQHRRPPGALCGELPAAL